jgi:hypothetical protein
MSESVWRIGAVTLTGENWILSHCHFVRHKSLIDWSASERQPSRWEAGDQLPEPGYSPTFLLYGYSLSHVLVSLINFT